MSRVTAIGECMIELRDQGNNQFERAYGGDVLNIAVYLKRAGPSDMDVQFMTAIGDGEPLGEAMASFWQANGIGVDRVGRVGEAPPGLYMIENEPGGERGFSYWRSDSPARETIRIAHEARDMSFEQDGLVIFSGITLAILDETSRKLLFDALGQARKSGTKVAFDPNFRPNLWCSRDEARQVIAQAYQITDIALTGTEDERGLFGGQKAEIIARLRQLGVEEIVVKDGAAGSFGFCGDQQWSIAACPVRNPVDATGAGDAFNGTFLARRLAGEDPRHAAIAASRIAADVVGAAGAIIPPESSTNALDERTAI